MGYGRRDGLLTPPYGVLPGHSGGSSNAKTGMSISLLNFVFLEELFLLDELCPWINNGFDERVFCSCKRFSPRTTHLRGISPKPTPE